MDVWNLDARDSKGWIREKCSFMFGLCEQCLNKPLTPQQRSIIDRCLTDMYLDIARSREKYIPVMSDFYERLLNQTDADEKKIAKDIALSLEIFVKGSLNIFNNQTNVDMNNSFTVYGI